VKDAPLRPEGDSAKLVGLLSPWLIVKRLDLGAWDNWAPLGVIAGFIFLWAAGAAERSKMIHTNI
jgi:hypothetical protein